MKDKQLKAFFSYFGSKRQISGKYPGPTNDVLVEPFAGAAGYSLRYPNRKIKLYDLDPIVAGVWDYIITAPEKEILSLPTIIPVEGVDALSFPQEAKWVIGFWLGRGQSSPLKKGSTWMKSGNYANAFWGESVQNRIASQQQYIRHWTIDCCSYEDIPVGAIGSATWFVDPPYEIAGCTYTMGSSQIDYNNLADWCKSLSGQTMVCENDGALWLPFEPLTVVTGTHKKPSAEVVWKNF